MGSIVNIKEEKPVCALEKDSVEDLLKRTQETQFCVEEERPEQGLPITVVSLASFRSFATQLVRLTKP